MDFKNGIFVRLIFGRTPAIFTINKDNRMKILWLACTSLILMACQGNTQQQVEESFEKPTLQVL